MDEKKVSIVLPVYNGEEHISEAIESILLQTYKNWELIIVNDCSTDSTLDICEDYGKRDKRIVVVSNNENKKLPKSLNVGFERASGDYYTWTSDDNMYKPSALKKMVDRLQHDSTLAMVYCDYTEIDENGKKRSGVSLLEPQFLVTGNVCGACFMYTSEVAKKVGDYDANLFLAEDYDYWMRILQKGKIAHIKEDLYYYRIHKGSLTETKKNYIQEQTYRALEKNFMYLYYYARKHKLTHAFFDQLLRRAELHREDTKRILTELDKTYNYCLKKRDMKKKVSSSIRKTYIYKLYRIMKEIIKR